MKTYGLETSVVEEFAGEMVQVALLDTEVLLEALELGVTLKDLGFVNYVEWLAKKDIDTVQCLFFVKNKKIKKKYYENKEICDTM